MRGERYLIVKIGTQINKKYTRNGPKWELRCGLLKLLVVNLNLVDFHSPLGLLRLEIIPTIDKVKPHTMARLTRNAAPIRDDYIFIFDIVVVS